MTYHSVERYNAEVEWEMFLQMSGVYDCHDCKKIINESVSFMSY